ncbi:hypothetical protein CEXT_678621 [Caerostris extrusa]|uniref:Secreted protein n=1 Tax=Caerostris extrusa TaxID=172846 RepID=A0AAV4UXI5_CAEEX|nr:hypothetical protein CEXT_678621 [Caerostris extrusa]
MNRTTVTLNTLPIILLYLLPLRRHECIRIGSNRNCGELYEKKKEKKKCREFLCKFPIMLIYHFFSKLALYKVLAKGENFYALVSLQTRANLSPFTKDYRGEEQTNEPRPIFGTPFYWG